MSALRFAPSLRAAARSTPGQQFSTSSVRSARDTGARAPRSGGRKWATGLGTCLLTRPRDT